SCFPYTTLFRSDNPSGVFFVAISPSINCNCILAFDWDHHVYEINYVENTVEELCMHSAYQPFYSTSTQEHGYADCSPRLELDCDDSSGAEDYDYNSPEYTCLSGPVGISDIDKGMNSDDFIEEMTVTLSGTVPDGLFEVLTITGGLPGIEVMG